MNNLKTYKSIFIGSSNDEVYVDKSSIDSSCHVKDSNIEDAIRIMRIYGWESVSLNENYISSIVHNSPIPVYIKLSLWDEFREFVNIGKKRNLLLEKVSKKQKFKKNQVQIVELLKNNVRMAFYEGIRGLRDEHPIEREYIDFCYFKVITNKITMSNGEKHIIFHSIDYNV